MLYLMPLQFSFYFPLQPVWINNVFLGLANFLSHLKPNQNTHTLPMHTRV